MSTESTISRESLETKPGRRATNGDGGAVPMVAVPPTRIATEEGCGHVHVDATRDSMGDAVGRVA